MFEAFKVDPARAAGRLLATALFGRPRAAPAAAPDDDAVVAAVDALAACVERFCSPSVLFEDRTRLALEDAHRLKDASPVDTSALSERIGALRARLSLLERRGLDHLPEAAYLRAQCSELLRTWREARAAQGELTGQAPAPPATTAA